MSGFDPLKLTVEEKIGQLFFIGVPGPDFDEPTKTLIEEIKPGGVCLFARNIKEARQTRTLLDEIRSASAIAPLLSLDQEGGRVDRLRRLLAPMPAAGQLRTADDARELGDIVGEAISLLGFNMNFAPVVDVMEGARAGLVNGLQTRGFGKSKVEVVAMAAAFMGGLEKFGILGCLKHFPGLAAAQVDSHEELPIVPVAGGDFHAVDLHPYRELLGREGISVMVAHATYPNADLQETHTDGKLLPSSLDHRIVTSLLRDELNFKGVAITDDMEMGAVMRNYGIGDASKLAICAGEDMIAICASPAAIRESHKAVSKAIATGEISDSRLNEAVGRIGKLKSLIAAPVVFDPDRVAEIDERIKKLNQHLN